MSDPSEPDAVTATLVGEDCRMGFLPYYFGTDLMMRGEAVVYGWMDRLADAYRGGFWHFYTLSNGGFYLAPDMGPLQISVEGNGYNGELSADAAGIVATLFALNQLAAETRGADACDTLVARYYQLRDYAANHPEAAPIFRAID